MLNDLSRHTRLMLLAFGVAIGVMVSGPVSGVGSGGATALLFGGLAIEVLVIGTFPVLLLRADRRFRRVLAAATSEIAAGVVTPVPAVGRLVQTRPEPDAGWHLPGAGSGPAPSSIAVLTAVGAGTPRRVAALVPPGLGLTGPGTPALLLLHPDHADVAVVDDRVTAQQLAAVDADPRWASERLPTNRTVVGGYLPLLVALVVGTGLGVGLGTGLAALAGLVGLAS